MPVLTVLLVSQPLGLALVLVVALAAGGSRSHLYHPGHFHGFRAADPAARKALRGRP